MKALVLGCRVFVLIDSHMNLSEGSFSTTSSIDALALSIIILEGSRIVNSLALVIILYALDCVIPASFSPEVVRIFIFTLHRASPYPV